jgi:hypothetical protein
MSRCAGQKSCQAIDIPGATTRRQVCDSGRQCVPTRKATDRFLELAYKIYNRFRRVGHTTGAEAPFYLFIIDRNGKMLWQDEEDTAPGNAFSEQAANVKTATAGDVHSWR